MIVPNRFPTLPSRLRLALIGEAPGKDEEAAGQPFIGASGRFLSALLSRAGISREACFLGNVSQHRPPANDIAAFSWNGLQIQHGLDCLRQDLETFNPNIVVLLGNVPLKAAKDPTSNGPLKKFAYKNSQWRGSLFAANADSPFASRKCMSTYHPAYCLRDYSCTPFLQFDLRKAVREAAFPELHLPLRTLDTTLTAEQICQRLSAIREARVPVALDIEGGIDCMSCISFATGSLEAFIVPFFRRDGSQCWTPSEATAIWRSLAMTLEDPLVPKVLQNSLYDRFVLHYSYGIRVRGVVDDTMLKHWELYSELEKALAVQASLYTDEPYYKGERKTQDDKTFFEYCCKDSAVTLEINEKLEPLLQPTSRQHYALNISLLNPMLYMELRGIRYDFEEAKRRRALLRTKLYESQAAFNRMTGRGFRWQSKEEIFRHARELMGLKRAEITSFPGLSRCSTKAYMVSAARLNDLLHAPSPNLATIGEIEDLCEVSLNVDSSKQFIPFLYDELALPTQYSEAKRGEEPHPTADYEALLKLSRECTKHDDPRLAIIHAAINIRALGTRQQMLSIHPDNDGRIRCGYNIVGSNTGRVTCYESPTGSGYNLQTIPDYTNPLEAPGGVLGDRDLFLADEDHWFFQCDLSGADGWTVAAYSAMLGDDTMLLDYKAGVSPFKILTLMLRGLTVPKDRGELREAVKIIGKNDWDRFACKRVQHGGSYMEGDITISRNILKDSEGKLYMPPNECGKLRDFFFQRYWGVRRWHEWVGRRLKERPILVAASGQVRQFFGRPDEILTKAVAFEPQANTTYATNLAMYNLWTDPENRVANRLRIEPLHQVHDALCGQFRKDDTTWATSKIRAYFNNPLQIAGQSITIPFEGGYGPSWGNLSIGKV